MNIKSILLVFFIFNSSNIFAQINFGLKTDIGVNDFIVIQTDQSRTLNVTKKQKEEIQYPYSYIVKYDLGVFLNTHLLHRVDIELNTLFTRKGSGINYYDDGSGFIINNYKEDYIYLEIPLFLKWNFTNYFSSDIGISNNILLYNFPSNYIFMTTKNKYNLGIYTGMNIRFIENIFFNISYHLDLNPVGSNKFSSTYFYNHSVAIGLKYNIFSIKRNS